jgi:hypothetical protein
LVIFEWDRKKAAANLQKHGIAFEEASTVFVDPLAATYPDPDHSDLEKRYLTLGRSTRGRVLVVAHLEVAEDHVRIISARRATRRESHGYTEEG